MSGGPNTQAQGALRSSESWGARYAGERSDGDFRPRKWRQCTRTDPARRVLSGLPAGHPPGCAPARHILGLVIAVDKWITSRLDTRPEVLVFVTRHAPLGPRVSLGSDSLCRFPKGPSCLRESVGETSPGSESAKIGIAGSTPTCYRRDGRSQPPGPLLESGSSPGRGRGYEQASGILKTRAEDCSSGPARYSPASAQWQPLAPRCPIGPGPRGQRR